MKLSPEERARFETLTASLDAKGSRAAPGAPGCRAQPLSYAGLILERRAKLGCMDD